MREERSLQCAGVLKQQPADGATVTIIEGHVLRHGSRSFQTVTQDTTLTRTAPLLTGGQRPRQLQDNQNRNRGFKFRVCLLCLRLSPRSGLLAFDGEGAECDALSAEAPEVEDDGLRTCLFIRYTFLSQKTIPNETQRGRAVSKATLSCC